VPRDDGTYWIMDVAERVNKGAPAAGQIATGRAACLGEDDCILIPSQIYDYAATTAAADRCPR